MKLEIPGCDEGVLEMKGMPIRARPLRPVLVPADDLLQLYIVLWYKPGSHEVGSRER